MLTPTRTCKSSHSSCGVQLVDRAADGERRSNGSLRIVLVRDRRAEQRDHRVADELLDRAAEALQLGSEADVVGREPRSDVLRVHVLGLRGRADDVGEEDRDQLPLLGRRLRSERAPHARQNFAISGLSCPQLRKWACRSVAPRPGPQGGRRPLSYTGDAGP